MPGNTDYRGREQILGLSVSKSLTPPQDARWCIIQPRTQGVWVRLDGVAADTTGFPLAVGQPMEITVSLLNVRVIEQAPSATLDVLYFS